MQVRMILLYVWFEYFFGGEEEGGEGCGDVLVRCLSLEVNNGEETTLQVYPFDW